MNYFIFNGLDSRDFGIHIDNEPDIVKPTRKLNTVSIDGRSGYLLYSDVDNEEVLDSFSLSITCTLSDENKLPDVMKWLRGYGKLILSNNSDKYYNALITNQIDFERVFRRFKAFTVIFECQPYAYEIENEIISKDTIPNLLTLTSKNNVLNVPNSIPDDIKTFILYGDTKYLETETNTIYDNFIDNTSLEFVNVKRQKITISNSNDSEAIIVQTKEELVLNSLPNGVKDTFNVLTGEKTQNVQSYTFDGTENWEYIVAENYSFFQTDALSDYATGIDMSLHCDLLPVVTLSEILDGIEDISINLSDNFKIIFPDSVLITGDGKVVTDSEDRAIVLREASVEALKEFLSEHPFNVLYERKYPLTKVYDRTIVNLNGLSEDIKLFPSGKVTSSSNSVYTSLNGEMKINLILDTISTFTIYNQTNTFSKPIITIYGDGEVDLVINGEILNLTIDGYIKIDFDLQNATKGILNRNNCVIGDYTKFRFEVGINNITVNGNTTKIEIIPNFRWY